MSLKTLLLGAAVAVAIGAQAAMACSFLNFSHDGKTYIGRTNELPFETDEQLIVVPRDDTFHEVDVKYGFVGINHGDDPFVSSGLNEHGVNIEGLGLGISNYAPKGSGGISMLKLPTLVLGNARSVDEAVELLEQTKVEADNMTQFGDTEIGFHFAITDNERSVIVEYSKGDGTPDIYDNEYGVMTNDPLYPEQVKMAEEMVESADVEKVDEVFAAFDRSAEGRFQQIVATNLLRDMQRVKTDLDAVNHTWAMVNSLEIPQGTLYWRFLSDEPQMTAYAVVIDLKNMDYYLRTYDNLDIRKVDVDAIDFSTVAFQSQDIYRTATSYEEITFH